MEAGSALDCHKLHSKWTVLVGWTLVVVLKFELSSMAMLATST